MKTGSSKARLARTRKVVKARTDKVKRERFLPFAFEPHGLTLAIDELVIDGARSPIETNEPIHVDDSEWRQLVLRGHIAMRPDLEVLPPSERGAPDVGLLLAVHCRSVRLRYGVSFPPAETAPFELSLARDDIAGAVELTPWLVRTRRAKTETPGFASASGARLASGAKLIVYPHAPSPRAGKFLDIRYVHFSDDAVLQHDPWRLYHLETHGETPLLRINKDHQEVAHALDAKGQTGGMSRLREVFFDVISRGVWSQLFMSAAESLGKDGRCRHRWQEGVLAALLPAMYAGVRPRDRVRELLADRDGEAPLSVLSARCDDALQRHLELVKHMRRLVENTP